MFGIDIFATERNILSVNIRYVDQVNVFTYSSNLFCWFILQSVNSISQTETENWKKPKRTKIKKKLLEE